MIRVELSRVAILSWASLDDKESTVEQEDVKGDICKEQYFEKIVLLEKGWFSVNEKICYNVITGNCKEIILARLCPAEKMKALPIQVF